MSEEEKKAIEYLKEHKDYFEKQIEIIDLLDTDEYDEEQKLYEERCEKFSLVLNLIEKQQKEIENSVSKDKIRRELEILGEIGEDSSAIYLKNLLEEWE